MQGRVSVDLADGETRRRYADALADLEAACRELDEIARRSVDAVNAVRRHLESGGTVLEIPTTAGLAELRADINTTFDRFNAARHRTRVLTMAAEATEGASAAEVARRWGVTRQYVSKLLHELDAGEPGS